jgi:hypothetical protein
MRFAIRFIGILGVILVALVACSSNLRELLPLADDKPTFMYFYTDN